MSTRTVTVTTTKRVKVNSRVEAWNTKNGANARLVTRRTDGKFVSNVSLAK